VNAEADIRATSTISSRARVLTRQAHLNCVESPKGKIRHKRGLRKARMRPTPDRAPVAALKPSPAFVADLLVGRIVAVVTPESE
jgi:hypothetical protein